MHIVKERETAMGRETSVTWLLMDGETELWFFARKKDAVQAMELIEAGEIEPTGDIQMRVDQWLADHHLTP